MKAAIVIDTAREHDLPAVRRLLEAQALPLDGVDEYLTMVVAKDGNRLLGAAAVELYADGALLRSVVVDPDVRGQRLGHQLAEAALNVAKNRGSHTAFLLTTTAEEFFPKLGFKRIARDQVPASVQASVEFTSACPASAVVMRKRLG